MAQINTKLLNRIRILLAILFCAAACTNAQNTEELKEFKLGAEQMDEYLPLLADKKVALLVNHTSLVGDVHLVDTLLSRNINIVKIFAPEHGFRGNAADGETIKDGKDKSTGLPVVSLYGSNKKPTAEMLSDVDVVIFDIQDVGLRFYTYISSMHYVMEACAENNKRMMVLDRPNPNGRFVDGPIREEEYKSFVGMHAIPILHGLTVGELAKMINGEGWLSDGVQCDLTVIEMEEYAHDMNYSLPVKPSPNLPNDLSIQLYPSLCLFEGTVISVGRGTMEPFLQIGHPDLKMFDYTFTPEPIEGMSIHPPLEGETCHGIRFDDSNKIAGFDLKYVVEFYELFPDKENFFKPYFETLVGTADLRNQIIAGKSDEEIRASWQPELDDYKSKRLKYLIYP